MKIDPTIQFIYVDLFCGAGGTSTGVEDAKSLTYSDRKKSNRVIEEQIAYRKANGIKCAKVIGCVNHDSNAIASHAANHPEALHFTEDIRTLVLDRLIAHVEAMRIKYPNAKLVLWASLECTNFSKAKGGMARDADSRTLAEHLFRYIDALKPDYIQIENVEEFMSWGDLDEKGKPISKTNGIHYQKWVSNVKAYGYDFDHRILNSADFGAYTSRKRFFGIFAKDGLPIVFPKPTHCKGGSNNMFDSLLKWKPVKECLDFSDEGKSIFDRPKDLVENSLDRILSGLVKFVAGGKDKWLMKYNSVNGNTGKHNPPSVDEPCPTVATQNRIGLVQTTFLSKFFSGHPDSKNVSLDQPAGTITTKGHHYVVNTNFISKYYSGKPDTKNYSVDEPAHTIRTKDSQALISAQSFLSAYYGNGHVHSVECPSPVIRTKDTCALVNPLFLCSYNYKDEPKDINSPCPTLLTKYRFSAVKPLYFMDMQYGNGTPTNINEPAATVTTNPKHQLVQCDKWLMNTNFGNVGSSLEDPSPVITANRKWHYLMNPQFKSKGGSVDAPCFTLIARMDKMPPYLIEATDDTRTIPSFIKIVGDTIIYEIYDTDSPKTKEIKEFMALYGIIDIKMRMLNIPELKMIMGFPKDYVLVGTQADQKKFIGNAVEVNMARVMCESLADKLLELKQQAA
ncbi:DNA cytosine methyltransferase [Dysgonomonas sp. 216]|uniref:DNA cytosine methyltransferase n=1 Tax=Dysgonomonas sp. 216 TaxID=2302934 RepID=UPI0013D23BB8|nr:DNA cytosine methyltransferase [Dysgonomonas sp. 216]NDW19449.1 DNA cytosine methyltransferase [Dysgonomonas sp. 216]